MRTLQPAAKAAIANGTALVSGALRIMSTTPKAWWSGYWPLALSDGYTYAGIGEAGLLPGVAFQVGSSEIGLELSVSGLLAAAVPDVYDTDQRAKPYVLTRLIFDQAGTTLLDAVPWLRGTVDNVKVSEAIGGASTVTFSLESVARGLGRAGNRNDADEDQRIISATDRAFEKVSLGADIVLYWGGDAPTRAGGVINGGVTSNGSSNSNRLGGG